MKNTATMVAKFSRAAKRAEQLIAAVAAGEDDTAARRAVEKVYDLASDGELRGDPAFSERASALHAARVAATESGYAARWMVRESELARLGSGRMGPTAGTHEHELAMMRAGLR